MHGHLNVKPTNNPVQCNNQKTDHHLYYSQRDNLIIYDSLLFLIAVTEHRFCIDRPVAKSVTAVHCKAQLYRQKKTQLFCITQATIKSTYSSPQFWRCTPYFLHALQMLFVGIITNVNYTNNEEYFFFSLIPFIIYKACIITLYSSRGETLGGHFPHFLKRPATYCY